MKMLSFAFGIMAFIAIYNESFAWMMVCLLGLFLSLFLSGSPGNFTFHAGDSAYDEFDNDTVSFDMDVSGD